MANSSVLSTSSMDPAPRFAVADDSAASTWHPPKLRPIRVKGQRLRIGEWVHSGQPGDPHPPFEAKFLFSRKKIIWEWKSDEIGGKRKIEIPFNIIDAMYGHMTSDSSAELVLSMNSMPTLQAGHKLPSQQPKWFSTSDFTRGFATSCTLHELELSIDKAAFKNLITQISEYSPIFQKMLAEYPSSRIRKRMESTSEKPPDPLSSLLEVEAKVDPEAESRPRKVQRVDEKVSAEKLPIEGATTSSVAGMAASSTRCSCLGVCSSACVCVRELQACSPGRCGCRQCSNPLNAVVSSGLSLQPLRSNQCLLDNKESVALWNLLRSPVALSCCGFRVNVLQDLASGFQCSCGARWQYSFCKRRLFSGSDAFKHCLRCHRCSTPDDLCACVAPGRKQTEKLYPSQKIKQESPPPPPPPPPSSTSQKRIQTRLRRPSLTSSRNQSRYDCDLNALTSFDVDSPPSYAFSPAVPKTAPFEFAQSTSGKSLTGKSLTVDEMASPVGNLHTPVVSPDSVNSLLSPSDAAAAAATAVDARREASCSTTSELSAVSHLPGPCLATLNCFQLSLLGIGRAPRFVQLGELDSAYQTL